MHNPEDTNISQRDYVIKLLQAFHLKHPHEAFTRQELFDDMPASVRNEVFNDDANALGKTLDALRKNGKVMNGESEYHNRKPILTWKIHPDFARVAVVETPEPEILTPAAAPVTPDAATTETSFAEAFADLKPEVVKWQCTDIDATVLDTNDQLEAALVDLIKQHRAYKHAPSQPTLDNPNRKREIIALLEQSLLVNPEFKTDLSELGQFIDQYMEVAA